MIRMRAVLALTCILALGCTQQQGSSAEEAAVVALLNQESRLAIDGDIDGLLSLYVQDDKNARLSVTKNVSVMITGWESIREHQANLLESDWMDWEDKEFSKENLWVKVHGNNAWAVCDNVWRWREGDQRKEFQNIQITICEKHDGRWKIAFQAFVRDPEHLDVIDVP
jgi:ketosteroid isomerase-like protein